MAEPGVIDVEEPDLSDLVTEPIDDQSSTGPDRPRALRRAARLARRSPLGTVGFVLIVVLAFLAIFAPLIAPHEPDDLLDAPLFAPPGAGHLFGTDNLGRDILTRVLYGGRVSLAVAVGSVLIATLLGGLLGMISGFVLGTLDIVVQRVMDAMMAVPTLVLALVVGISFGASIKSLVISISIAFLPQIQRVVRSAVIAVRGAPFIEAARAGGCSSARILIRHVAPQVVAPGLVISTALIGQAIIIESAISFIGAGPPPPTSTWGGMLSTGMEYQPSRAPWLVAIPGVAIFLSVFAFNLVGDALRDILDPRLESK